MYRPLVQPRFYHARGQQIGPGYGVLTTGRYTHGMVVGESGTLRGFRPTDHPTSQFGEMHLPEWGSLPIWQLTGGTGTRQNLQLRFGTFAAQSLQYPGVTAFRLSFPEYGERILTWDVTNSRYNYEANPTTENIYVFLGLYLGKRLPFSLGVAD